MATPMLKKMLQAFLLDSATVPRYIRSQVKSASIRHYCVVEQPKTENSVSQFNLMSALVLERCPILSTPRTELEEKYFQHLNKLELENSVLSNHELRHKADLERAANRLRDDFDETTVDVNLLTAADMEDIWNDELKNFQLASRKTEADATDDRRTSDRCMDRSLYLLVKQKFDAQEHWVFPQTTHVDGESMRQTAERVADSLQRKMSLTFLGNAPSAYEKRIYPKIYRETSVKQGAKVFYYKARLKAGTDIKQLENTDYYTDHTWATIEQVKNLLNASNWRSIKMLLHEY